LELTPFGYIPESDYPKMAVSPANINNLQFPSNIVDKLHIYKYIHLSIPKCGILLKAPQQGHRPSGAAREHSTEKKF